VKTIRQIAEIVNVSKTSVYNIIKKYNIETFQVDGKTCVDDTGIQLIAAHYQCEISASVDDIREDMKGDAEKGGGNVLEEYKNVIRLLETELTEKNKTINGLVQVLAADKFNDTKRLVIAEGYPVEPPVRGFFARLFRLR
jgi:predicted DNA-binding protein YlxM (UPF0122 family)